MPRIARLKVKGETAVYHLISRTALVGFVLTDTDKEYLVEIIKKFSSLYFAEVLGYTVLDNHFLLLSLKFSLHFTCKERNSSNL